VKCFINKSKDCSVEIDNGLLGIYRALLAENSNLREETEILKARLGITNSQRRVPPGYAFSGHAYLLEGNAPTIRGQAPPSL
jgi:hypothetical protein